MTTGARPTVPAAWSCKSALNPYPVTSTPAEFGAFLRADMEKWARVIREANIRVESIEQCRGRMLPAGDEMHPGTGSV